MVLVTTFLLVLIGALLIGNGLLFLFAPKKEEEEVVDEPFMILPKGASVPAERVQMQPVSIVPLERKVDLAHKRLQLLEQAVIDSSKPNIDITLKRKVERLDNFRSTVEAELIGMKEILQELQNNNITIKARTYKKKSEGLSTKKMKSLIFNNGGKKKPKSK